MNQLRKLKRQWEKDTEEKRRAGKTAIDRAAVILSTGRSGAGDVAAVHEICESDLVAVTLDAGEGELRVSVTLPVGDGEDVATYEQTFDTDDDDLPEYAQRAMRDLATAGVRLVRERYLVARPLPCASCTAPCCRGEAVARLTQTDIDRMDDADIDVSDEVVFEYEAPTWNGFVGEFVGVDWADGEDEQACPHLQANGCSIYEHRPDACRQFSAWTCDMHEEDDDKISGRVRLRVVS